MGRAECYPARYMSDRIDDGALGTRRIGNVEP